MFCDNCGSEALNSQKSCSVCGAGLGLQEKTDSNIRVAELKTRLAALESKLPNSKIINVKFWPRAFAVFGHNMAVVGILYGAIFVIALFIGLLGLAFK